MAVILKLSRLRDGAQLEARSLAEGAITIGRGPANDWALADPERYLSRTHCRISLESGRIYLDDLSANGVFINDARESTARDSRVALNDGDTVRLGDYTITIVEALAAPPPPPLPPFGGTTRPADPLGDAADPFGGDPFGRDPFGGDPLGGDPLQDRFGAPESAFVHPRASPRQTARVADPFDLVDENRHCALDPDDDLFHGVTPSENWQGGSQPDNADAPQLAFVLPKTLGPAAGDDFDFDALLGDTPPGQFGHAPQPPPLAPPPPGIAPDAAASLQTVHPTSAPPVHAAAAPPRPAADAADADALLTAFLNGAGVADMKRPKLDPQATLTAAGTLFGAMVAGLWDVLMSRGAIKNELRVEQTKLAVGGNNALKFAGSPEEAIATLLFGGRRGYKPPVDAAREAFADIKSHEMAMLAGMQTALMALLKRFDPASLEARLQPGGLTGMLSSSRKARAWDIFCATYNDIAREAEDDFQSVFGREFVRAYDAQMRKLSTNAGKSVEQHRVVSNLPGGAAAAQFQL